MDLPNRRRRQGHRVELGEHRVPRTTQVLADHPKDHLGRIGGHVVLKLLEFGRQIRSHQIGPRAEDLAQLDECGPQFGQGHAHTAFKGVARDGCPARGLQQVLGELRPQAAHPLGKTVLAEHPEDLAPTVEMAIDLRDGRESHGKTPG
jgi:hypothetical protein